MKGSNLVSRLRKTDLPIMEKELSGGKNFSHCTFKVATASIAAFSQIYGAQRTTQAAGEEIGVASESIMFECTLTGKKQAIEVQDIAVEKPTSDALAQEKLYKSVVKVDLDSVPPNYCKPWEMKEQRKIDGSGFAIDGQRILTTAKCVGDQARIMLRKTGDSKRYPAEVIAVAHDFNVALLSVKDAVFWKDVEPLKLGGLPASQDSIIVVGYGEKGDNLSATKGVVSTVDLHKCKHSGFNLLNIQTDAQMSTTNAGGPALNPDGEVIGVATEEKGFITPMPIVKRFLDDVEKNGKFTGLVTLPFEYQSMENPSLKNKLQMNKIDVSKLPQGINPTGVLVYKVDKLRLGDVIKPDDVILALNGIDVADNGTIAFRGIERVALSHAVTQHFAGDKLKATIWRDGKVVDVEVPLFTPQPPVPLMTYDKFPKFLIYGGLVFSPLTMNYLVEKYRSRYLSRAPYELAKAADMRFSSKPNQEVVILQSILSSELTVGYDFANKILLKVDDEPINSMSDLVKILGKNSDKPVVEFQLDDNDVVILNRKAVMEKGPGLLERHGVARSCSDDLKSECEGAKLKL